jgi:hypothetical protein
MGLAPADTFGRQDAPHLTATDGDPVRLRGGGECIQCPVGGLALSLGGQLTVSLADQLAGWIGRDEGDHLAALCFSQPRRAPGAGAISETIDALSIEADNALTDGLGMTVELGGNRSGALPLPTAGDHTRPLNPVSGGVPTAGQLAHLTCFDVVLRWSGKQ